MIMFIKRYKKNYRVFIKTKRIYNNYSNKKEENMIIFLKNFSI